MKISKKKLYLYSGISIAAIGVAYFVFRAGKSSATSLKINSASTGLNVGAGANANTGAGVQTSQPAYKPQSSGGQVVSSGSLTKAEAEAIQYWLVKTKGYDLGTSGANKDGVDGIFGTKSRSAFERATGQAATTENLKKFAYELMNPIKGLVNSFASSFGFDNPFSGLNGGSVDFGDMRTMSYLEAKL